MWVIGSIIVGALLLPLLIFPLGPDQSMFYVSGQRVLHGALHYRDVIDVKPPLIFHVYAVLAWLDGGSAIAVNVADLILQAATCLLIVAVVRRAGGDRIWAFVAAALYALWYVSCGYVVLLQTESITGLCCIGGTWLILFDRRPMAFVLAGASAGVAFESKFTLGILLAVFAAAQLLPSPRPWSKSLLRRWALLGVGFALVAALFPLYLLVFHLVHDFQLANEFIRGYVSMKRAPLFEELQELMTGPPLRLADGLSSVMAVALVVGTVRATLGVASGPDGESGASARAASRVRSSTALLRVCAIGSVLLFATVVLEARYYSYQVMRIFAFASIPASYAMLGAVRSMNAFLRRHRSVGAWSVAAVFAGIALVYGPLPRYAWLAATPTAARIVAGSEGELHFYHRMRAQIPFEEIDSIGRYIDAHAGADDEVYVFSTVAAMVHHRIGRPPGDRLYHSMFITGPWAPRQWVDSTRSYILHQRPEFLVVQHNDFIPDQVLIAQTSEQTLFKLPGIRSMVDTDYIHVLHLESFDVYRRRSGDAAARADIDGAASMREESGKGR